MRSSVRCLWLSVLVGCAASEERSRTADAEDPISWSVDQPGPLGAGWRGWEVSYSPAGQEEARTFGLNLWYPTDDETGEPVYYMGVFGDPLAHGNAVATPPMHDGRYPVMVHSHGFQGWGGTGADLARYFASHGWVVVAPDHLGNTLLDHVDPLETAHYLHKPQDLRAALDVLEHLPDTDPLAGLADTSRVLVTGHSFGASYATWALAGARISPDKIEGACSGGGALPTGTCTEVQRETFLSGVLADERVVAAVPLAGTIRRSFFGEDGHQSVTGPVLSMTGSEDGPEGALSQWEKMDTLDFTWVELEGGCHQTFALGVCDTLDPVEGFAIVNTYTLAFGRAHVLGDTTMDPILDGSVPVGEAATLQRQLP